MSSEVGLERCWCVIGIKDGGMYVADTEEALLRESQSLMVLGDIRGSVKGWMLLRID